MHFNGSESRKHRTLGRDLSMDGTLLTRIWNHPRAERLVPNYALWEPKVFWTSSSEFPALPSAPTSGLGLSLRDATVTLQGLETRGDSFPGNISILQPLTASSMAVLSLRDVPPENGTEELNSLRVQGLDRYKGITGT